LRCRNTQDSPPSESPACGGLGHQADCAGARERNKADAPFRAGRQRQRFDECFRESATVIALKWFKRNGPNSPSYAFCPLRAHQAVGATLHRLRPTKEALQAMSKLDPRALSSLPIPQLLAGPLSTAFTAEMIGARLCQSVSCW
jgi:hypothetical protein